MIETETHKIICITGRSATGKDTIYQRLMQDPELCLHGVISYTTRPMRIKETDGVDYHFCTVPQMEELEAAGKIIERRTYATVHGDWHYFTVDDGQIDLTSAEKTLMVVTPEAVASLRRYFGTEAVYAILIHVDPGDLLQRALTRERKQEHPRYAELCRRFLADEADFAPEKLEQAGIDAVVENQELEEAIQEIKKLICGTGDGSSFHF